MTNGLHRSDALRDVAEEEATGAIAELYDQIRVALRSPNVNLIYRLLASRPAYLAAAWSQVRPNLASRYLEREAERLRGLAALDVGTGGVLFRTELGRLGIGAAELAEIRGIVDLFNYANPKNLIVITALCLAFEGRVVSGSGDPEGGRPVPAGPLPAVEVRLLEPAAFPPEVRSLLSEMATVRPTGGAVPSVYRALAHWPTFLRASWSTLRPLVTGPEFSARVGRLVTEAERSALGLPHPVSLAAADTERRVGGDAARAIGATLERFRRAMIPSMTVEIHTLKALLDGPHAAASSSLAWRP